VAGVLAGVVITLGVAAAEIIVEDLAEVIAGITTLPVEGVTVVPLGTTVPTGTPIVCANPVDKIVAGVFP
jgi:hypothetical protein